MAEDGGMESIFDHAGGEAGIRRIHENGADKTFAETF